MGATWSPVCACSLQCACAHQRTSCRSWGRQGPDVYHMSPQRSNSVSRFGIWHLLILGTILSALRAYFLIQIMILLEGDRNLDTTSKLLSERSHYTNMSGSRSSCLSVQDPVSRVPTVGGWGLVNTAEVAQLSLPRSWNHDFLWSKDASSQPGGTETGGAGVGDMDPVGK